MEFAIDCSSPGICFGNTPVSLTDLHGSFSTSQYLASITSFGANNSGASSQSLIASSANSNQYCQISSSSGSTPDTIYALNDGSCFLSRYKCSNSNLTIYAESCSQDRLATTFQLSSSTLSSVTGPDNQSYTAQMVTFNSASVNIIYTIFQIFGFVFLEFHSPQGVIGFLAVLISILLLIYHIAIYSIQLFHVLRSEGLTSSRNRRMSIVSQSGGRRGISRKWRLIVYVFTLTLCLIESITFLIEYFFVFKIPASTYPTAWTQSFNGICYSIASLITCLMNAHNLANIVFETNLSDGMLKVWSKVGLYGFIFVVWFFLGSPYLLQYILINPHSTATVANSFAFQLNQYFSGWIYPYWPIFCFCFDPLCAFIVNRFLFKTLSSSASRGEEMVGGVKRGLFTYIIHDRYLLFLNLVVFVNLFSLVISQILIQCKLWI